MSHPCEGRDELLLKFAHGQLGPWQRLQVQWHVRRCPACSGRLEKLSMLSSTLAVAMASGSGPRWLPTSGGMKWGVPRSLLLGGIIVVLTVGLWSVRNLAQATDAQPAPAREGCVPPTEGISAEPTATVGGVECEPGEKPAQPSASN